MSQISTSEYIGTLDKDQLSHAVISKMQEWNTSLYNTALTKQWVTNWDLFYNTSSRGIFNGGSNGFSVSGDGRYLNYRVIEFQNVITAVVNMLFTKPPALKSLAKNSDPESLNQIKIYDAWLDYSEQVKRTYVQTRKAVEIAFITGTGAIFKEWDKEAGEPYAMDNMRVIPAGDARTRAKSPFEFITDIRTTDTEDVLWYAVIDYYNKFELAARFPEFHDQIVNIDASTLYNNFFYSRFFFSNFTSSDVIPVFKFYHKPVRGLLPNGRYSLIIDKNCVPLDIPYPYGDTLPLFIYRPMDWMGTIYGQTIANQLSPIQMFNDLLTGALATNIGHYGIANIMSPKNSGLDVVTLSSGANVYEYNPGMPAPQPLNLLDPALMQIIMAMKDATRKDAELLSSANSVIRGDPQASLKSNAALMTIASQAMMFSSRAQLGLNELITDCANFDLALYKKFADAERTVSLVGQNQTAVVKKWSRDN